SPRPPAAPTRFGQPDRPWPPTRCRSSCPATAFFAPTATWASTAAARPPKPSSSPSRRRFDHGLDNLRKPAGAAHPDRRHGRLAKRALPGRSPSRDPSDRDPAALTEAVRQLKQYFAGERSAFELALDLSGTTFQQRVWRALQQLPYGRTTTYGGL